MSVDDVRGDGVTGPAADAGMVLEPGAFQDLNLQVMGMPVAGALENWFVEEHGHAEAFVDQETYDWIVEETDPDRMPAIGDWTPGFQEDTRMPRIGVRFEGDDTAYLYDVKSADPWLASQTDRACYNHGSRLSRTMVRNAGREFFRDPEFLEERYGEPAEASIDRRRILLPKAPHERGDAVQVLTMDEIGERGIPFEYMGELFEEQHPGDEQEEPYAAVEASVEEEPEGYRVTLEGTGLRHAMDGGVLEVWEDGGDVVYQNTFDDAGDNALAVERDGQTAVCIPKEGYGPAQSSQ